MFNFLSKITIFKKRPGDKKKSPIKADAGKGDKTKLDRRERKSTHQKVQTGTKRKTNAQIRKRKRRTSRQSRKHNRGLPVI
jgi:hypothetical protein